MDNKASTLASMILALPVMRRTRSRSLGWGLCLFIPTCLTLASRAEEQTKMQSHASSAKSEYFRCIDASQGITGNLMRCNAKERHRLAPLLTNYYRGALARLSPAKRKKLMRSQGRWQARYEQSCKRYSEFNPPDSGTLEELDYDACITDEIGNRLEWLKRHYPPLAR